MTSAPTDAAAPQFSPPPQPTSRNVSSLVISNPAKREIDLNSFVHDWTSISSGRIRPDARDSVGGNARGPRPFGLQTIHRSASKAVLEYYEAGSRPR